MKTYAIFSLALIHLASLNSFSQQEAPAVAYVHRPQKIDYYKLERNSKDSIITYQVEEKINMKFGAGTTTYTVSNPSLINTNDLGPDNQRIVRPKYGNPKSKVINPLTVAPRITFSEKLATVVAPLSANITLPKERYITINKLATYERMLEKGFKTVEMLQRVGDKRFFEGDFAKAAQWYGQLFDMTTDLESEYYYRYAVSLYSICQDDKALVMMQRYEELQVHQ